MVKFCGKCGAPLDEGIKFCGKCGWKVEAELSPAQAAAEQPAVPAAPPDVGDGVLDVPPKKDKDKKKKSKAPFVIGGTSVVAIALAAVLIVNNFFGLFGNLGGGKDFGSMLDIPKEITDFWKKYDWNKFDPADLIVSLGNATFTLDNNATATGEFVADGKTPLVLSVTDSKGATWTLDVPADALLYGETITMTAMRDVSLGGEKLDGGVQLSPDGLTFLNPAKLTVKSNEYNDTAYFLQGNHDGGNATYVAYKTDMGSLSVTATIRHFSTVVHGQYFSDDPMVLYDPDTGTYTVYPNGRMGEGSYTTDEAGFKQFAAEQAELKAELDRKVEEARKAAEKRQAEKEAEEKKKEAEKKEQEAQRQKEEKDDWDKFDQNALKSFRRAVAAAQRVCARPLNVPVPPSITNKCNGNHSASPRNNFNKQFMEPEKPIIDALDAIYITLVKSYKGTGYALGQVSRIYVDTKTALNERLLEKVKKLIETYKYQEDKFNNVAYAWLVTKLSGIDINDKTSQWADNEMKTWARKVWDELMTDVVEKHDLRQANHLLSYAVIAIITVGDFGQGKYEEMAANALTFKLEWEMDLTNPWTGTDGTTHVIVKGEAPKIRMELNKREGIPYFGAAGLYASDDSKPAYFQYVSYDFTPVIPGGEQRTMIANPPAEFAACLFNIDPCEKKNIQIGITIFDLPAQTTIVRTTSSGLPPVDEPIDFSLDGDYLLEYMKEYQTTKPSYKHLYETIGYYYIIEAELRNERANCVEKKLSYSGSKYGNSGTWDIKLIHVPQGKVYFEKADLPLGSGKSILDGLTLQSGLADGGGSGQRDNNAVGGSGNLADNFAPNMNLPEIKDGTTWPTAYIPGGVPVFEGGIFDVNGKPGDLTIYIREINYDKLNAYVKALEKDGWDVGGSVDKYGDTNTAQDLYARKNGWTIGILGYGSVKVSGNDTFRLYIIDEPYWSY